MPTLAPLAVNLRAPLAEIVPLTFRVDFLAVTSHSLTVVSDRSFHSTWSWSDVGVGVWTATVLLAQPPSSRTVANAITTALIRAPSTVRAPWTVEPLATAVANLLQPH